MTPSNVSVVVLVDDLVRTATAIATPATPIATKSTPTVTLALLIKLP